LRAAAIPFARTELCADFHGARSALSTLRPSVLVTNLRLEDYNGLHLVLLGRTIDGLRSLVHTDRPDFGLIAEAHSMGALFEFTRNLPATLPNSLRQAWPRRDRRDPRTSDRRSAPRGGRRAYDIVARA
jgi:hypothetical protein